VKTLDARRLVAIRRQRGLVAIFDLDGALAPIAPTPESARVSSATRRALRALARRADTTVGVVSGRHLYQVERLIGAGGLWIAGLHGYVRRAPAGRVERLWSRPTEQRAIALAAVLRTAVRRIAGARVERKGPVVALHVRAATPPGRRLGLRMASRIRPRSHALLQGRRVIEFRPARCPTKGDAVRWIARQRPGAAVLYVGDDATDEDAFATLGAGDFGVRVDDRGARRERSGRGRRTRARHRLAGPAAVARLIDRLARAR
jgi:trehalose-phosphatase